MQTESEAWMAYIDSEVWAVCKDKGLGHQIRRRAEERQKPTWKTLVEGYEWKLIVGKHGRLPQAPAQDFEGSYYVLRFDRACSRFVLQHDTDHVSYFGSHWERATFTEIQVGGFDHKQASPIPGVGWLRDHLLELLVRFGPNHFSAT